jgi:WhiB family redox-sensing transcriptional regulator
MADAGIEDQSTTRITGLCRYDEPEKWFPRHPVPRARVIRICNNCPFQPQCARAALDTASTDGVWAGVQLPGERAEVADFNAAREKLHEIADRGLPAHELKRRCDLAAAVRFVAETEQRKFAEAWNEAHDEHRRRTTTTAAVISGKEPISA